MTQKAKKWLYRSSKQYDGRGFLIEEKDGGIAGSLAGLGFIKRDASMSKYQITLEGQEWIKNQGVK